MPHRVTIIIPVYNCPYVHQAIESALNQTYPHKEVLVIDDGSTLYKERIEPYLSQIHYIGKANGGTASALNYGISLASGEYIAWLSSDDQFYPLKVERQLQWMQEVGSRISFTSYDEINERNEIIKHNAAARFSSPSEFVRSFLTIDPVNGCTLMMHRDIPKQVGLFDETFRYTHDYDYWIRVLLTGIPIDFLDEPLTLYRWHEEMGTNKYHTQIKHEISVIQQKYEPYLTTIVERMKNR
ncbi:glycosyltransferase-like protein [Paenibacillus larvae subsp. larvae]|uniref:Glycosyltransferase-like protein n=1 Tax=Paenibacillus larvae subsp. larvae TaxID=147375 RepID=A0A2L1UHF1_9BACL|nr:glycosyltransferase [Paenibacillus larvae]AQT84174.1 glycosyl transferase [Paenibacillus larvae subsp. pulvifaciens]AQZ46153.1 glycosyl transferase [Paenibacillus larvae subsp. pulvifaciens]AVF27818.1 glycosyltransferase-like protein [Paenibacillus larvae subsp. larvae]AVF32321.1 glycosyltransferase-like protein [Paenibacillus larvae subsp. larvae]MBH0342729.1 glycosyl transferase [Paenibacillus larvae]